MNANISITPENMHAHLTQSEKHALTYSCPFVRVRVESRPRFTSNLSCQVCIIIPSTSDFFTSRAAAESYSAVGSSSQADVRN